MHKKVLKEGLKIFDGVSVEDHYEVVLDCMQSLVLWLPYEKQEEFIAQFKQMPEKGYRFDNVFNNVEVATLNHIRDAAKTIHSDLVINNSSHEEKDA